MVSSIGDRKRYMNFCCINPIIAQIPLLLRSDLVKIHQVARRPCSWALGLGRLVRDIGFGHWSMTPYREVEIVLGFIHSLIRVYQDLVHTLRLSVLFSEV